MSTTPSAPQPATDLPFVSVVVAVLHELDQLCACLAALERQTYPADDYEVIVVKNGHPEDAALVVAAFAHVRLVYEPRQGFSYARNCGVHAARGPVIAFTDADCLPAHDWIERGVAHLSGTPNCGLVGGKINLSFKDPARLTAGELYERLTAYPQQRYIEQFRFGVTANLFTTKQVVAQAGLFDERASGSEDLEWGQRVHAAGFTLAYADDAVVQHPARATFGALKQKLVRVTTAQERLRAARPYPVTKLTKAIVKDVLPYRKLRLIWTDARLQGLEQRLKVTAVLLGLRLVRAWARLRVRVKSRRIAPSITNLEEVQH